MGQFVGDSSPGELRPVDVVNAQLDAPRSTARAFARRGCAPHAAPGDLVGDVSDPRRSELSFLLGERCSSLGWSATT